VVKVPWNTSVGRETGEQSPMRKLELAMTTCSPSLVVMNSGRVRIMALSSQRTIHWEQRLGSRRIWSRRAAGIVLDKVPATLRVVMGSKGLARENFWCWLFFPRAMSSRRDDMVGGATV
jgi:hypothetical protein